MTVVSAPPAQAACHAFTVSASPATVTEGGSVTVTVTRDGAVAASSIDVKTVNGSAVAGQDYTALQQKASMTSETSKSYTVATTNDSSPEAAETFKVHLENPGGCAVNPNFSVGPDATVTIQDNDAAATTAPAPTVAPATTRTTARATTTAPPTTTTTAVADTTTSAEDTTVPSTTSDLALAGNSDDGGGGGAVAVLAVAAAILAAGGVGFFLYRRRAAASP
jgi:hypothetical protein